MLMELARRGREVLAAIQEFWETNGYGPTFRDLQILADIPSSSTVTYWLDRLAEKGFVLRDETTARSIRLTAKGSEMLGGRAPPG